MNVTVRFFAWARDLAGRDEITLTLPPNSTLPALTPALVEACPELARLGTGIRFAVNQEYADDDCVLNDGDEIAVIPPVSGG